MRNSNQTLMTSIILALAMFTGNAAHAYSVETFDSEGRQYVAFSEGSSGETEPPYVAFSEGSSGETEPPYVAFSEGSSGETEPPYVAFSEGSSGETEPPYVVS
ncbi:MAG: hypothetical protein ACI8WB_004966 [Phenylobacterium sp.]|jgi:hypothetical protein